MLATREILYLNPRGIEPNRENVRRDCGDIIGLAETIREHGILQPLGVIAQGSGYRVVFGDRRREAAILVGLDRVPCLVLEALDDGGRLITNILENLQRLDLNDLEKARAFEKMLDTLLESGRERGDALDTMTRRLGLSASQIRRYLSLLELAPAVQDLIGGGELGVTQAQHLRQLSPASRQEAVAKLAADENLSAAETGRLAAALGRNPNIDPAEALAALRRGESVADFALPERDHGVMRMPAAPAKEATEEELFENEPPEDEKDDRRATAGAPNTRDGNRVRKIHSLDSFADEVDRLARCVQDGDLAKLLIADAEGRVKGTLLAKQLAFLARAVDDLIGVS